MPCVFFLIMSGSYWAHSLFDEYMLALFNPYLMKVLQVIIVLKIHMFHLAAPGSPPVTSPFSSYMCSSYMSFLTILKVPGTSFYHIGWCLYDRVFAHSIPSVLVFPLSLCSFHYCPFSHQVNVCLSFR